MQLFGWGGEGGILLRQERGGRVYIGALSRTKFQ